MSLKSISISISLVVAFNSSSPSHPITGEGFKRSIAAIGVYNPITIPDSLSSATVIRLARIDDRNAYVLTMESSSTESIQLFFDVESGLLLRRVNVTNTMLGPLTIEYSMYPRLLHHRHT
jgi:hypothetical protein